MKSGLVESQQADLGTDMLDQQLSVSMSGVPGGLSEAISLQLSRQMTGTINASNVQAPSTLSLAASQRIAPRSTVSLGATSAIDNPKAPTPKGRDHFVQHHSATAERVAQDSGIPAAFMLGQAGHETGWGKSQIRTADGGNSFNLFGIKAGKGWTGKVATVTTTEYIEGQAHKVTAKFRAYDSFEDSFRDYARLITNNPRYERAMDNTHSGVAYASALQKAGYATDPDYARKLSGAINSAIASAQRAQPREQG